MAENEQTATTTETTTTETTVAPPVTPPAAVERAIESAETQIAEAEAVGEKLTTAALQTELGRQIEACKRELATCQQNNSQQAAEITSLRQATERLEATVASLQASKDAPLLI